MSDLGVVYALLAACFGGGYIFGIKRFLTNTPPAGIAVVTSLVAIVAYAPFALWTSLNRTGNVQTAFSVADTLIMALAIGLSATGYLLFLTALGKGDVSYVAPLSKVVPAFVLPIEILLFGAFLTRLQVLGIVTVTLGVYLVNYRDGPLYAPLVRVASSRSAQLALASAAAYGAFDVSQRFVLQEIGVNAYLWVLATRVGIAVLLLPVAVRTATVDGIRSEWSWFLLLGVIGAFLSHFGILAFSLLPASIASPIVNAQSIVAVGLGGLLLRETAVRYRALGAILAIAGIGFIVLG